VRNKKISERNKAMKKMTKIAAIIMAISMVLALAIPAFAADTYKITINKETAGHKYEAYQIFTGSVSTDDEGKLVLSSIKWGTGVTAAGQAAMGDAQAKADTITSVAIADAFADEVSQYLTGTIAKAVYSSTNKNYVISNLVPGYYLIKDEDGTQTGTEGYTAFILKVVGDAVATPKDGNTSFEKKVDDKNDSIHTEDAIEWHDSADHDIGDLIDFQLKTTIAENYAEFDNYYLALHDTEEKGLTFDPSTVKVYVDGVLISTGYRVDTSPADGHTFDVIFDDLKDIASVTANSEICVTYKSRLNEQAVLGNMGNVNKAYAEFSNSPDDDQRGKSEEDSVIVFTYKVTVNKKDKDLNPLPGATFTLEKFVADESGAFENKGIMGNWVAIDTVETQPDTTFTFNGLDDGSYRLTETEAPEGYNAIDPITFDVNAEHEVVWTMARGDVLTSLSGDVATGEIEFTADKITGNIGTDIINEKGIILPETGGFGTTLFYTFGALFVVGAAIFLITKKRMGIANA
jgi:fimbrial isopeptide formation D2 family protein/LPXTG-motif cell wall-anchored protein